MVALTPCFSPAQVAELLGKVSDLNRQLAEQKALAELARARSEDLEQQLDKAENQVRRQSALRADAWNATRVSLCTS